MLRARQAAHDADVVPAPFETLMSLISCGTAPQVGYTMACTPALSMESIWFCRSEPKHEFWAIIGGVPPPLAVCRLPTYKHESEWSDTWSTELTHKSPDIQGCWAATGDGTDLAELRPAGVPPVFQATAAEAAGAQPRRRVLSCSVVCLCVWTMSLAAMDAQTDAQMESR